MKKFFALALALVMITLVNLNAQTPEVTNEATVDVHVLQPLTVNATDDFAELIVINTENWEPGNQTTDNNVLEWTITGSGGHDIKWVLTTLSPEIAGGTETVDFAFSLVDSRSGVTNDANATPTSGDVVTSTPANINDTHAEDQTMTVTLTITGATTTGSTPGIYSAIQTLTAEYQL